MVRTYGQEIKQKATGKKEGKKKKKEKPRATRYLRLGVYVRLCATMYTWALLGV